MMSRIVRHKDGTITLYIKDCDAWKVVLNLADHGDGVGDAKLSLSGVLEGLVRTASYEESDDD